MCLVIFILHKLLSFYAYIGKSSNALLFINDYFRNLLFVTLRLLRSGDAETNPGRSSKIVSYQILSLESIWPSCP